VFSIVSKDYKIIRHEQAIGHIKSIIARNDHLGKAIDLLVKKRFTVFLREKLHQ